MRILKKFFLVFISCLFLTSNLNAREIHTSYYNSSYNDRYYTYKNQPYKKHYKKRHLKEIIYLDNHNFNNKYNKVVFVKNLKTGFVSKAIISLSFID